MSNNDIALSFDTAEYYSLQEASEYLNRKHKTDNLTPKKLLKQISSRDINIFIHFRMDNLSNRDKPLRIQFDAYDSNVFSTETNIFHLNKKDLKPILEILKKLERFVSNRLIDELYMGSFLFRVSKETLFNMSLNNNPNSKAFLFSLDGFIRRPNYNDNPSNPTQLEEWQLTIEDENYQLREIGLLEFVIDSTNDEELQDFKDKAPFSCSFEKRNDFSFAFFDISPTDLIILHKDLIILEEQIATNRPNEEQVRFEPRKGISQKKILAKEYAKHIAEEHWKQDVKNEIKISEMCELVWSKLVESSFNEELPNYARSLKPWIKEVAPEYASEGGRPPL